MEGSSEPRTPYTNSYTLFFREFDAIKMVQERVLIPRAQARQSAAIWSAGCASGEEPYSLAILAREAGADAEIIGSDVNIDKLAVAKAGLYSAHRLRQVEEPRRRRWFDDSAEGFTVNDELRRAVKFRRHDIGDGPLYPRRRDVEGWHAVLFRYVQIYLSEERTLTALTNVSRALAPDGILLVGASEWISTKVLARLPAEHRFECVNFGGVIAYQRAPHMAVAMTTKPKLYEDFAVSPATALRPGRSAALITSTENDAPVPVPATRRQMPRAEPSNPPPSSGQAPSNLEILRARGDEKLDRGLSSEALRFYREALGLNKLATDLYLRSAHALIALQKEHEAKEALRRCLFLEPNLWPAATLLGDILHEQDPAAAKRYFIQAQKGLDHLKPGRIEDMHLQPFLVARGAAKEAIRVRLTAPESDTLVLAGSGKKTKADREG